MGYEFADRLIELRRAKGLSQEELAREMGLSRQAISKWERAESAPDIGNLVALSNLYGVSLDEIVRGPAEDASAVDAPVADVSATDASAEQAENDAAVESAVSEVIEAAAVVEAVEGDAPATGEVVEAEIEAEPAPKPAAEGAAEPASAAKSAVGSADEPMPEFHWEPESVTPQFVQSAPGPQAAQEECVPFAQTGGAAAGAPPADASAPAKHRMSAFVTFPYPIFCVVFYLLCGFCFGAWHPMWIIFLTIPFYYWVVALIKKDPEYRREHGQDA